MVTLMCGCSSEVVCMRGIKVRMRKHFGAEYIMRVWWCKRSTALGRSPRALSRTPGGLAALCAYSRGDLSHELAPNPIHQGTTGRWHAVTKVCDSGS